MMTFGKHYPQTGVESTRRLHCVIANRNPWETLFPPGVLVKLDGEDPKQRHGEIVTVRDTVTPRPKWGRSGQREKAASK